MLGVSNLLALQEQARQLGALSLFEGASRQLSAPLRSAEVRRGTCTPKYDGSRKTRFSGDSCPVASKTGHRET